MKHTPGPWRAVRDEVWVGKSRRICPRVTAGDSLSLGDEMERANANARLIAAAPALLEALQWVMGFVPTKATLERIGIRADDFEEGLNRARAAIKQATGEEA